MKQLFSICAFLCFFTTTFFAQTAMHRLYEPTEREHFAFAMVPHSSGFYMLNAVDVVFEQGGGTTWDNLVSVMNVDEKGNLVWTNNYTFPMNEDQLVISADMELFGGDTLAVMLKISEASLNTDNEVIIAIEPNGDQIWSKSYGGHSDVIPNQSGELTACLIADIDESIIIGSAFETADSLGVEHTKIDNEGTILSSQRFSFFNETSQRMIANPRAGIINNLDTSYYFSGEALSEDFASFGSYLSKTDSLGNMISTNFITEDNPLSFFVATAIGQTPDTSAVLAGFGQDITTGFLFGRVVYMNADTIKWAKGLSLGEMSLVVVNGVTTVSDGVIVTLEGIDLATAFQALIGIKFDFDGNVLWQHVYPQSTPIVNVGNQLVSLVDDYVAYHGSHFGASDGLLGNNLLVIDPEGNAICNDTIGLEIVSDVAMSVQALDFLAGSQMTSNDLVVEKLEVDSVFGIPMLTLADTTYCPQDPIMYTIDATYEGGVAYLWNTEEITPSIIAMEEGEFTVEVTAMNQYGCYMQCDTATIATYDSMQVAVVIDEGPWCETRMVNYLAVPVEADQSKMPFTYLWSTGETTPSISLPVPSEAAVTVTDDCGIEIFASGAISEDPDTPDEFGILFNTDLFCGTGVYQLEIFADPQTNVAGLTDIVWFDGAGVEIESAISVVQVPGYGSYSFTAVDNCNFEVGQSITISEADLPPVGSISITADDSQICEVGVILNAASTSAVNLNPNTFEWSTGTVGSQIIIEDFDLTYMVSGEDCGRPVSAEFMYIPSLDEQVGWPNIFSPSGLGGGGASTSIDTVDTFFGPMTDCPDLVTNYELRIYNRWGQLMFESSDITNEWDGRKDGEEMPGDTYVFFARYSLNGIDDEVNGSLLLVR